ncbi:hypothetical protein ANN_08661 [Periplaneta americana]|uniref:Uncharacterized protein n=1 Tax=Periplaneta americana TaxID=6978 RepID=A0ABQ8T4A3_PERAM|nr:hypothetical protein ANN_08661 [Periplaneta americana]
MRISTEWVRQILINVLSMSKASEESIRLRIMSDTALYMRLYRLQSKLKLIWLQGFSQPLKKCANGLDARAYATVHAREGPRPTSRLLASRPHAEAEVNDHPTRMEVSCG